ncbi:MAG: ATP-binding protein [Bacteroidota bacterium]
MIFFLGIAISLHAQSVEDLPKVKPSYSEDFSRIKSFPSMCFDDVFFGKNGELWLKTCGGSSQMNLLLFQFDGYEFRSLQDRFAELKGDIRIREFIKGHIVVGKIGAYESKETPKIFTLDLYSGEIQKYELPEKGEIIGFHIRKEDDNISVLLKKEQSLQIYELVEKNFKLINEIAVNDDFLNFDTHNKRVVSIVHFDDTSIWLSGRDGNTLLQKIDIKTGSVSKFLDADLHLPPPYGVLTSDKIYRIGGLHVFENRIFLQVSLGPRRQYLLEFDFTKGQFFPYRGFQNNFKSIELNKDEKGNFLFVFEIYKENQIAILEDKGGSLFDYSEFFYSDYNMAVRKVVGKDFKKELLACSGSGLRMFKVKSQNAIQSFLNQAIRAMQELPNGEILVTTQDQDRYILNLETKKTRLIDMGDCYTVHQKLLKDDSGNIWGANRNYFVRYDYKTNTCEQFPIALKEIRGIRNFAFLPSGKIVFETQQKIGIHDLKNNFTEIFQVANEPFKFSGFPHDLLVAKDGTVWLATSDGFHGLDIEGKKVKTFEGKSPISDSRFLCIDEDESGRIWLGTPNQGIYIFDPNTNEVKSIKSSNGLANNTVVTITSDNNGNKWIGTYNGVSLVSPEGRLITNFYEEDGVVNRESNRYAKLLTSSGKILVGSVRGITMIDPKVIKKDLKRENTHNIYLTKVKYFDSKTGRDTIQQLGLDKIASIHLPAENRNVNIHFATSSYMRPSENKYAYTFASDDNNWTEIGNQSQLNFNNLTPGNYQLRIRGGDGVGNLTQNTINLNIVANEFFYKKTWFYLLLAALGIGGAFLWILRLQSAVKSATKRIRNDKEIIERQAEELKELDRAKSQFFTNISHEFRTPLTIISGMIDQVGAKPDVWLEKGTKIVKQNTLNLLNLINQILDLRKLESKSLKLNLVKGDMIKYLRYLTDSFESYAENEGLKMHYITSKSSIIMDYDPDKILRVISNLLSNAIKYNKEKGNIYFHVDQVEEGGKEFLKLQVQDTGKGIPKEKLDSVFDRFFQVNEPGRKKVVGSGIGLALTQELIHLMQGEIDVKSELDVGTTFVIKIPITRNSEVTDALSNITTTNLTQADVVPLVTAVEPETTQKSAPKEESADLPRLLIVEDNPEIIQILEACLEDDYQLLIAHHGQEGIDLAIEHVPDLIVSDVMMPIKDGFELCDTLKQDERTSHIPIILLTAKSDLDSKISGLDKGADAYLSKPFESKELLVRIKRLLELRLKLQEKYKGLEPLNEEEPQTVEDIFIQKVRKAIEDNISDETFGIIHLCRAVALSRSQLHNKIKALTGMSTSIFVRSVRLKRAKELLKNSDLNVSEVAYEVGFKNSNYFSTLFLEEYGVRPSETRK